MLSKASPTGIAVIFTTLLLCIQAGAAEIRFIPMIDLKEEYNDNVFFDSANTTHVRDTVSTVSPGIRLTDRTEKFNSLFQSWVHFLNYYENTEMNTTDQDYSGSMSYRLTERWDASAQARYTRDSQPDRDIDVTGLIVGTSRRKRYSYNGSTNYALTERAGVGLSYTYNRDAFNDPDLVDYSSQSADASLSYDLSDLMTGTIARIQTGYTLYSSTNQDITEYSYTAGVSKQLSEAFSLSGYIGQNIARSVFETWFWFFPIEERSRERTTIGQLMLSYSGDTDSAGFSLYHDIQALSGSQGATTRTSARLSLGRRFTADLRGSLAVEYYLNKAQAGQLASEDIDQQTLQVRPGLTYSFTNDLFLQTSYRFVRLKNYEDDEIYRQSVYSLSLVWQYPVPE